MRIENKYLRNRRFRSKAWKRIRNLSHPYETFCPYDGYYSSQHFYAGDTASQVARNFEWIGRQARSIDKGEKRNWYNPPASFRRELNKKRRAAERHAMSRINMGDYEYEVPHFKRDAAWLYF